MIRASGPRSAVATQRLSSLTHRQEMTFVWPWGREAAKCLGGCKPGAVLSIPFVWAASGFGYRCPLSTGHQKKR